MGSSISFLSGPRSFRSRVTGLVRPRGVRRVVGLVYFLRSSFARTCQGRETCLTSRVFVETGPRTVLPTSGPPADEGTGYGVVGRPTREIPSRPVHLVLVVRRARSGGVPTSSQRGPGLLDQCVRFADPCRDSFSRCRHVGGTGSRQRPPADFLYSSPVVLWMGRPVPTPPLAVVPRGRPGERDSTGTPVSVVLVGAPRPQTRLAETDPRGWRWEGSSSQGTRIRRRPAVGYDTGVGGPRPAGSDSVRRPDVLTGHPGPGPSQVPEGHPHLIPFPQTAP